MRDLERPARPGELGFDLVGARHRSRISSALGAPRRRRSRKTHCLTRWERVLLAAWSSTSPTSSSAWSTRRPSAWRSSRARRASATGSSTSARTGSPTTSRRSRIGAGRLGRHPRPEPRRVDRVHARGVQAARRADQPQLPLRRRRAPPRARRRGSRGARLRASLRPSNHPDPERAAEAAPLRLPRGRQRRRRLGARRRRVRGGARRRVSRRATSGRARPTTSTCSTPAAPRACPKGTLWRQEDIFFAALGGGNFGGEPIARPEQIADNATSKPRATLLAIAPMMHGGGQWVTFNAFFAANTLVLYTGSALRSERDLAARRARARDLASRSWATRWGARWRRRSPRRARTSISRRSRASARAARSSRRP